MTADNDFTRIKRVYFYYDEDTGDFYIARPQLEPIEYSELQTKLMKYFENDLAEKVHAFEALINNGVLNLEGNKADGPEEN